MLFTLSKLFKIFKGFGGKFSLHTHISRIMDPISEQCFCFCNLYFVLHDYQKAGDKAMASLDKGLVVPLSTK